MASEVVRVVLCDPLGPRVSGFKNNLDKSFHKKRWHHLVLQGFEIELGLEFHHTFQRLLLRSLSPIPSMTHPRYPSFRLHILQGQIRGCSMVAHC